MRSAKADVLGISAQLRCTTPKRCGQRLEASGFATTRRLRVAVQSSRERFELTDNGRCTALPGRSDLVGAFERRADFIGTRRLQRAIASELIDVGKRHNRCVRPRDASLKLHVKV